MEAEERGRRCHLFSFKGLFYFTLIYSALQADSPGKIAPKGGSIKGGMKACCGGPAQFNVKHTIKEKKKINK